MRHMVHNLECFPKQDMPEALLLEIDWYSPQQKIDEKAQVQVLKHVDPILYLVT
jgi:hypothetical protein